MIDSRLENDSIYICHLESGQLRMIKDGDNEWFILVPEKENCFEIIDLDEVEQHKLLRDINLVSKQLKEYTKLDKINVAALGNVVKQLHIHIIARYESDRAWPGAIWGTQSTKDFDASVVDVWKQRINNA